MKEFVDKSSKNIGYALGIIAVVTTLGMMHGDSTLSTPLVRRLLSLPNYVCVLYCIFKMIQTHKYSLKCAPITIAVVIWFLIQSFHSYSGSIESPLYLIILLLFSIANRTSWRYSFVLFRYYLIIVSILGIIAYLSYLIGLPLNYEIVPYYSESLYNGQALYVNYKFSYILEMGPILRLCGLFAEPGQMGTLIAMFLIVDRFNLRKKENIIMLIACLFTLSLAAFFLMLIYLFTEFFKNKKSMILAVLSLVIVWQALNYWAERNEMVEFFVDRIVNSTEEDGLSRVGGDFETHYKRMFDSGNQWFGYGNGYTMSLETPSSGYKPIVLDHGIIGFVVLIGGFLFAVYVVSKRNWTFLILMLCFIAIIYKSGSPYRIEWMVMLLGGIEYSKWLVNAPNDANDKQRTLRLASN